MVNFRLIGILYRCGRWSGGSIDGLRRGGQEICVGMATVLYRCIIGTFFAIAACADENLFAVDCLDSAVHLLTWRDDLWLYASAFIYRMLCVVEFMQLVEKYTYCSCSCDYSMWANFELKLL